MGGFLARMGLIQNAAFMPLKSPGSHSATNKKGLQALTCNPS